VKGKAVAGVIYQPYFNYQANEPSQLGRTIWAITGVGIFGLDVKTPPAGKKIICTSRSHSNVIVNKAVDACKPTEVMRVGGSGHKVLLLLEGKAHAYVFASPGTKKWDTCAPEAILHTVGGKLTDLHGHHFHYDASAQHKNTGGILATCDEESHHLYLQQIPKSVQAELTSEGPPSWQLTHELEQRLSHVDDVPLVMRILAACVTIAQRSGELVRGIMRQGDLGIVEKGVNDLQTEADRYWFCC
jgi:3'(2'), 5'-bisphosphate nucleotidase